MDRAVKVNHRKRKLLNHLKNHFSLCYIRSYNNYYYAHFNPLKVVHFDRFLQRGEVNTTISTVYVLANALKVEITDLFKFQQ